MKIPFYRQESGVEEHDSIADILDGDDLTWPLCLCRKSCVILMLNQFS